jgi:hypothetical protein
MSFFDVSSVDASAERYIRILEMAPQARRKDADCTLLLCVATRIFAGHVDWLRSHIEPKQAKVHGDGFSKLHKLWNEPFLDDAETWGDLPSRLTWLSKIEKARLRQPDWAEGLFPRTSERTCPLAKWGEVAGHFRNALSHGGVRWVRDGRPAGQASSSSESLPTLDSPARRRSIGGLVLVAEETRDGPTVRACRISPGDFEALLFCWLRAIKASGIRASADDVVEVLRQAS